MPIHSLATADHALGFQTHSLPKISSLRSVSSWQVLQAQQHAYIQASPARFNHKWMSTFGMMVMSGPQDDLAIN